MRARAIGRQEKKFARALRRSATGLKTTRTSDVSGVASILCVPREFGEKPARAFGAALPLLRRFIVPRCARFVPRDVTTTRGVQVQVQATVVVVVVVVDVGGGGDTSNRLTHRVVCAKRIFFIAVYFPCANRSQQEKYFDSIAKSKNCLAKADAV